MLYVCIPAARHPKINNKQDLVGDWDRWVIHHNGIMAMVDSRGGVESLEGDETLRVTVSWYVPSHPLDIPC